VIGSWTFRPAEYLNRRVGSAVLVVTLFRPPQLYDNASLGSPPVDLVAPSDAVPFPILEMPPKYPPNAIADGVVVLVEVLVGLDGKVEDAALVGSAPGFESAALDAARGWVFRPARYRGEPVPAYAYLVFGFRAPVTVGSPSLRGFE
jgi:TonB family protein